MSRMPASVSHVSDTARWVAIYRAMESERPDALFHDPWARKLGGPQGEAIVRSIPRGRQAAWAMIVRTQVMDEIILRTIADGKIDTVLNLASGLDTRPYRLPLPSSLRWVEVDFQDVLAYKRGIIGDEKPRCVVEYDPVDLTDNAARLDLMTRIGQSSSRTLVITEGLLVYLQPEQVARLARDLCTPASFRWWLIDLASPDLLKRLKKSWGKSLAQAPFIFGPPEGTQFFDAYGWREKEYHSLFDESFRLNRTMPFARVFRFMGRLSSREKQERFKRFSGIALLERR